MKIKFKKRLLGLFCILILLLFSAVLRADVEYISSPLPADVNIISSSAVEIDTLGTICDRGAITNREIITGGLAIEPGQKIYLDKTGNIYIKSISGNIGFYIDDILVIKMQAEMIKAFKDLYVDRTAYIDTLSVKVLEVAGETTTVSNSSGDIEIQMTQTYRYLEP